MIANTAKVNFKRGCAQSVSTKVKSRQQGCTFWAVVASKCTGKMMNFSVLGVSLLNMVRNNVLTKKPTIPIWMKIVYQSSAK